LGGSSFRWFCREGATAEALSRACRGEAATKAEEVVAQMTTQSVFGRVPAQTKARRRRGRAEVKALYFRSLFKVEEGKGYSPIIF
jgi:hypothetical protein